MRWGFFFIFIIAFGMKLLAVPALPISKRVMQRDSSYIEVFLRGDEHCHFYCTRDNIPIAESEDGSFYHVFLENNVLQVSSVLAHEKGNRLMTESQFINTNVNDVRNQLSLIWREKLDDANLMRSNRSQAKVKKNDLGEPKVYKGDKKGLVILVNFANRSMSMTNANEEFSEMFNEVGYNKYGAVGSVHDYFYDQSYGQFNLSFDVVGPVKVSNNYGYYGSNGMGVAGSDQNVKEMIIEACNLANDKVNYADYDWDGDGEVDQVFVIYAGYGEASGGPKNTIWPHESHLTEGLILDGVRISTYACSCELTGGSGTTLNGIGTACHEFSHCLGLPDLYDTSYSGGFGMSYWDIMSSGSHCGPNGHGEVPTGYSAYERQFAGWIDYKELNSPCVISDMPSIADEPVAYAIYNDNHRDEYFLLENRQNFKWFSFTDTYENCHGLLVTHVDYNEKAWKANTVNSMSKHQRMTIIPADKSYGNTFTSEGQTYFSLNKSELQGDLFPGLSNATELTNTSHTATGGRLYNLNTDESYCMNKPLTKISESNGLISFYFMGGIYVPTPDVLEATEITNNSFTANWTKVEEADNYTLELSVVKPQGNPIDNIIISENLAGFKSGANTADGFTDLADQLDNFMQHKGWQGQKVFSSQYGAKIGTTSTIGYLLSPTIIDKSSNLTIRFSAKAMASTGSNMQFVVINSIGNTVDLQECQLSSLINQYYVNFENLRDSILKIRITSPERIYLSDIIIYDGYYIDEDFESYNDSTHMIGTGTTIVDNIAENKIVVTDLAEDIYRYRVRANHDGAYSDWSPYQEVDVKSGSGIKEVSTSIITSEYHKYNLQGIGIGISPQPGIYIIRYKGNKVKKIIIK